MGTYTRLLGSCPPQTVFWGGCGMYLQASIAKQSSCDQDDQNTFLQQIRCSFNRSTSTETVLWSGQCQPLLSSKTIIIEQQYFSSPTYQQTNSTTQNKEHPNESNNTWLQEGWSQQAHCQWQTPRRKDRGRVFSYAHDSPIDRGVLKLSVIPQ